MRYVRVVYGRLYVILSETKDLKVCTTIHCHGDLEILHSVQNDRVSITQGVIARLGTSRGNLSHDEVLYNVMLSEVEASPRWLYTMCAWPLVGFEEILRYTRNDNMGVHLYLPPPA